MATKTKKRSSRKRQQERDNRFANVRSLKRLKEERLSAYRAMERLRRGMGENENGRFTAEQRQEWDRATRDYNDLSRQINVEMKFRTARREIESMDEDRLTRDHNGFRRKQDSREVRTERAKVTNEHRNLALQAWFMTRSGQGEKLSRDHRRACKAIGLNRRSPELEVNLYRTSDLTALQRSYRRFHPSIAAEQARTFSINSPVDGAVLTMPTMVNSMEQALMDYSGIMQVADIIVTDTGNLMKWPTANDTGNKGRRIGANKKASKGATNIFKSLAWGAHKYTSDGLELEQEMIEDAGFDLVSYIPGLGAERIARIFNDEATSGTGENMPEGTDNVAVGKTTASATAITPEEIIDLIGSVDSAYRQGAQFMMNDALMTEIAKMKDGQNNFIWRAGLELGQPDRIRGYGIVPNVSMASAMTATKITMLFGQLKAIKVRRVRAMRITRERNNEYDVDKFYIYVRMDSKVLDAGTHPIKSLKQHA